MIRRGEIYWVNLDPTVGSEIKKTRPGLVVSNDLNNLHGQTVTVLPVTSNMTKVHPFEVLLPARLCGLKEDSKAKADQVRTVDKRRLGKLVGFAPAEVMKEADAALRLHLDLEPPPQELLHDGPRYYLKKAVA